MRTGGNAEMAARWTTGDAVVDRSTRRIVVVGAESTGTTTLVGDLADHLCAPWVPEALRALAAERAAEAGTIWDVNWTPTDFDRVADHQDQLEVDALALSSAERDRSRPMPRGPLLICDTDALATALWCRRYLGAPAPRFLERARARPPALYVLTSPEGVAFHQDGLRDGEHIREEMTGWFRTALHAQTVPWVEVTGDRAARVARSVAAIDRLTARPGPLNPMAPTGPKPSARRRR